MRAGQRLLRWWRQFSTWRLFARVLFRVRALFILGIVSGMGGVIVVVADSSQQQAIGVGLAVAGLLGPTLEIARFNAVRQRRQLRAVSLNPPTIRGVTPWLAEHGYRLTGSDGWQVVRNAAVDDAFTHGGDAPLVVSLERWESSSFEAEDDLQLLVLAGKVKRGQIVFDDQKIRLRTDLIPTKGWDLAPVEVQPTTYLATMWTNDITDLELLDERRGVVFRGVDLAAPHGLIQSLEASACSNSVGVSTVAFDLQGTMYLTLQAVRNSFSAGLLAPTGSGSADWSDMAGLDAPTLVDVVHAAVDRELREEGGLHDEVRIRTQVIGFGRWVARGGQPQFFCLSVLDRPTLGRRRDPVERLFTFQAPQSFPLARKRTEAADEIAAFIARRGAGELSFPLYWCLERIRQSMLHPTPPALVTEVFPH
jgi:hypothetical protein